MNTIRKYFVSSDKRSLFGRRKPVILKVWQYQGENSLVMAPEWTRTYEYRMKGELKKIETVNLTSTPNESVRGWGSYELNIPTMEGVMRASAGDWLIQGVQGEIWACKPEVFVETYELIDTADGEPHQPRPIDPINGLNDDPVRLARARNMAFEGIDHSKVKRDLRHSIVDRRVLLAEIDRLLDVVAEKDQRLIDLNDEKRLFGRRIEQLQQALAFWLPRAETSNGLFAKKQADAAALIPEETLERDCAEDLQWIAPGKNSRVESIEKDLTLTSVLVKDVQSLTDTDQSTKDNANGSCGGYDVPRIAELMAEAARMLRSMEKYSRDQRQYIKQLEAICAASYQMAGAYGAPTRFLDALALHQEYLEMVPDEIIEQLLPVETPETIEEPRKASAEPCGR